MTYLRPHNRPRRRLSKIAAVMIGLILIAGAIVWRAPDFFPGIITAFGKPFWQAEFSVQSGALSSKDELMAENESLKRRLSALETEVSSSSVAMIIQENAEWKALFYRASTTPFALAAVIMRPPSVPYDELIIDLGSDDGVSSTSLVFASGNVLIGKVSEALPGSSKILLLSSPGQSYDVSIGPSHVPATAVGKGGGQYEAKVPHGAAIAVGDPVSDQSLAHGPFGAVVSVYTDPSDPFDQVLIAPPVNLNELRWVLVDTVHKK